MANYPVSLDTITNPTSGNTLDNPSHSLQHSDANDILEALETKLGIGASPAGSATSGYALVASTGGTTSWTTIGTAGISSGTATSGQVLTANGSGAVTFSYPGLTLINTTSFSAVSSQSINDVFNTNFKNYLIRWSNIVCDSATDRELTVRLRVGGVDNSTASSYIGQNIYGYGATVGSEYLAQAQWILTSGNNVVGIDAELELTNPFTTDKTGFHSSSLAYRAGLSGGSYWISHRDGFHNQTISYTGFTLLAGSGTMTGKVSVYGYNE